MVNAKAFRVSPWSPKSNFREPLQAKMDCPQNVVFREAPQAKMDQKEKIRDLKQQFEEFWEPTKTAKKPTKGGAPPPFVGVSIKILRTSA